MFNFLSQIDFGKLFQKEYLLEINPDANGLYKYLTIVFGLMIILSVVLFLKKPAEVYKKLYGKVISLFLIVGLIGIALIFFRFEAMPYLGSRLMFLVLIFVFLIWLGLIVYYRLIILPKEIKQKKVKENFEKYLPGGDRKKE